MLSEAFASVLSARRPGYNAQFLAARRGAPELDEEAFRVFLTTSLDPLVSAVAVLDPAAVVAVVDIAYSVGLELLSQRLAGPRAQSSAVDHGFQNLFPLLTRFIARAPETVLPRLSNALCQLGRVTNARVDEWCSGLARSAPHAESVEQLMAAGQIMAWRSGLAHYRPSALALCRRLPSRLVSNALEVASVDLHSVLVSLEKDPWFLPSAPELGFRLVGSVGGFRGFQGEFVAPPRVTRVGQQLFVISGDEAWLLALDAFGRTLHRARPEELTGATFDVERPGLRVERRRVTGFGKSLPLHDAGALTSVVGNVDTLLFTTTHSYAVTVVALREPP